MLEFAPLMSELAISKMIALVSSPAKKSSSVKSNPSLKPLRSKKNGSSKTPAVTCPVPVVK